MPTGKRKSKKDKEDVASVSVEPPKEIEPIVLQLAITPSRLDALMETEEIPSVLEYNPVIVDPQPYCPHDHFTTDHDTLVGCSEDVPENEMPSHHVQTNINNVDTNNTHNTSSSVCFWCCHSVDHMEYGMPIRYDVYHKSFTMFGRFCSLECVAAYNFSVHMGSDRVWEIHSWIQMLASRYGFKGNVRPAPSRYALQMFDGPMTIEEFRNAHTSKARTCIMNIPPFIHVNSQMEVLNTSFLDTASEACEKSKTRKKLTGIAVEKKTVESKLPTSFGP